MRGAAACVFAALAVAALQLPRGAFAYDNGAPHSRLPPLGWSSWDALAAGADHPIRDFCDTVSVKAAADAYIEAGASLPCSPSLSVVSFARLPLSRNPPPALSPKWRCTAAAGLYDAGYRHLHLDDCWAATTRNASGYIQPDPARFPGGMKEVADYVHSKGLVFGLYTSAGKTTCMGGRAGSQGHWAQDAASFAEWGVDWVTARAPEFGGHSRFLATAGVHLGGHAGIISRCRAHCTLSLSTVLAFLDAPPALTRAVLTCAKTRLLGARDI